MGHFLIYAIFYFWNDQICVKTIFFKNPILEQNGDSRRTPRVDSDTEDQENDEIEIDEHSSVSTNENSDDVQIEEETVNIGNGEKRRQNGQKHMVSDWKFGIKNV